MRRAAARTLAGVFSLLLLLAAATDAAAYPLDGYDSTGINRLRAYDLARDWLIRTGTLVPGSLWGMDRVKLRLADGEPFDLPTPDEAFTAQVRSLIGEHAKHYGVTVLDLSDPKRPRYADVNGGSIQNPGSVGKIVVALGWFQALADRYPDDTEARARMLRKTVITANRFVNRDHHVVPFWKPGQAAVIRRPLQEGDSATLYTFLDWMCSASSNAGASMLMAELVLFREFGAEYPLSPEASAKWFDETPKAELTRRLADALQSPLRSNGLDPAKLRQGSLFTREGKKILPGTNSVSTSRELARYLLLMDQGRLVDRWSSLEIKRLLYLTDARIRYASAGALNDSALYFKSGSLYGCKDEPGFKCGQFMGNRINYMNSIALVETERKDVSLHYIVTVLSNVLRKNSAEQHERFGGKLHELLLSEHATPSAPY